MPPRDSAFPDDFTVRSASDPIDRDPRPLFPAEQTPQLTWQEGDRVMAPWEPHFLYLGQIAQIEGSQVLVEFDDGEGGWVLLGQLRRPAILPKLKVMFRPNMGPTYVPGQVLEVRGDQVRVESIDGKVGEWTRMAALRIPCEANGPAAVPVQVASQLAFLEKMRIGDRVWAPWESGTLYAGTVKNIRDREAHIHYDDGDQGWVLFEQLLPLELEPGLKVLARRKLSGKYLPASIIETEGERVHLQFDDAKREWTKTAALVIPCQPFGPNARPTKSGNSGSGGAWGWVIPLAIGIGLAVLRISCK